MGFSAPAHFGLRQDGTLDQPALAHAYMESDWDLVTTTLESYLRLHGDSRVSPEERIFAYKYLGVIYAADSLYHSKSESYFTRLLKLSPKVEIFDLFPSKKVDDFFHDVKREYEDQLKYTEHFDSFGHETDKKNGQKGSETTSAKNKSSGDSISAFASQQRSPKPVPVKNAQREASLKPKSSAWVWWTVGIAATAAAGAGAYYLASQEPGTHVEKEPEIIAK